MNPTELILASSSPARQTLLRQLGLPFTTVAPNINETPLPDESIAQLVIRLARDKANAVAIKHPNAVIIGADSIGILNNQILAKPMTHEKAIEQLEACSGKSMTFFTGLCVLDSKSNRALTYVSELEVYFKTLTPSMIEGYLNRDKPYQCAGSIKIEQLGISLIEKVRGDDYTAIIGLPLMKLSSFLQEVGMDPLG